MVMSSQQSAVSFALDGLLQLGHNQSKEESVWTEVNGR